MSKHNKFELHNFMCIKCGNIVYSLPRQVGHQHKREHRKKLYCPHCKIEINCIECKDDTEMYEFRNKFFDGAYASELT